jgi:hypothetical protein
VHQGALAHRSRRWSSELAPTALSHGHRSRRKLLKTVTSKRVRTTTTSDLLANRWRATLLLPPGMKQAGYKTRPELLVCGGAPRRNRIGDPILTMDRGRTAVLSAVFAGGAKLYVAKLWAQSPGSRLVASDRSAPPGSRGLQAAERCAGRGSRRSRGERHGRKSWSSGWGRTIRPGGLILGGGQQVVIGLLRAGRFRPVI